MSDNKYKTYITDTEGNFISEIEEFSYCTNRKRTVYPSKYITFETDGSFILDEKYVPEEFNIVTETDEIHRVTYKFCVSYTNFPDTDLNIFFTGREPIIERR